MKNNKKTYLIIFVLSFIFYFVLSRVSSVPLIYPDEAGYIGWAYKMIYGSGDGLRYLPGYSFLLVPVLSFFKDIRIAFPVITALNAVLTAGFALVLYCISEKLEFKNKKLITIAVCLYPAVGLYVNFSMCESLLNLCYALLCLAIIKLSENINRIRLWIFPIALSAFLCITHSRCIALLPAFVLCLFPKIRREGRKGIKILYFSVLTIGIISAILLAGYLFLNKDTVNAAHLARQIAGLFTLKGMLSFGGTIFSHSSYLILSTYGVITIGVYYTARMLKTHKTAVLFMLLSFVFSAALSAVFMYHHENPSHILYGRYTEYTIYPILLAGIGGILENGIPRRLIPISVMPCVITALIYGKELSGIDYNAIHSWGIYIYRMFFYNFSYVSVAITMLIISVLIFLVAGKKTKLSVIVLCVCFGLTTVYGEYDYFVKGASPRKEVPQLVSLLENETEIKVAASSGDSMVYPWEYFNYTVYNPYLQQSEDANLVLSSDKLDLTLVGVEKHSRLKLYSENGGVAVETSGKPEAEVSSSVSGGKLKVDIKNNGNPWLCKDAADGITEAVRAGLRVYKDGQLIDDLRCDFSDNVYDRATVEFDFPYPDGEYVIVAETIREFLYRGGEGAYRIEKAGNELSLSPSDFSKAEEFSGFDPLDMVGTEGFYRYYVTEGGAYIPGVWLEGNVLEIETYGEHSELKVDVIADGSLLEFEGFRDGSYFYRVENPINKLEIHSETYKRNDNFMSFLTTESNFKPVDWFVRGMKKVFGISLDHRGYGVDIKRIKIHKEDIT